MADFVFSDKAVDVARREARRLLCLDVPNDSARVDATDVNDLVVEALAAAVAVDAHRIEQETREKIADALDAACLGRTAAESLRRAGNEGRPLKGVTNEGYYVSTHVTADLCQMADVVDRIRAGGAR